MGSKSKIRNPGSTGAFTLIEILVVVSIIAILMGLILATAGYAMSKARRSRVEAERDMLITAIQSYKAAKGFYPQGNSNNFEVPPLFYELTGTTITLNNATTPPSPASYTSTVSGDVLTPTNVVNIFGVGGFVNASPDPTQVQNFLRSTAKSARTGQVSIIGVNVTVFGVQVPGPNQFHTVFGTGTNGPPISPWFYNATNPTNNPDSYDLWMDVYFSGRTNRVSNWSQNPQPQ
jgi:prepilin-type N-terminal cleavage/methylation domain-containing protein